MRSLWISVRAVFLVVCVAGPVGAQDPGDVGSQECRQVQLEVYNLVAEQEPFKNHGQLMKTINVFINAKIHDRMISGRCAACIRSQFARKIPVEEQVLCGEDPVGRVIKEKVTETFERIRSIIDADDTSPPTARFIGSHVEVASVSWVYVLNTAGKQVFRPVAVAPHMESAFLHEIGPDVDTWAQQRVPEETVSLAQEIAFAALGAEYVFDPSTHAVPVRELITSKATEDEALRSFEGRTTVLFRPAALDDERVESLRTTFSISPDGEPVVRTLPLEIPARSYETAVAFAPAGHVLRVESGFLADDTRELLGVYQQALAEGSIFPEQVLYENTLRFGGFFSPEEPRLELTAHSYEGEAFLDPNAPYCENPSSCNPFWPFAALEDHCYNSPYSLDVAQEIRPSRQHRFHTFNIWHDYGRKNGIRGNWDTASQSWEIPNVEIEVHASLRDYELVDPPVEIRSFELCDEFFYPFWFSTGNKLEQGFYDDLESSHVAMINTHGGPIMSDRVGRPTFQFLRNYDEWVTLHEAGDDGLGKRRLRHLFLETCSTMNWRNNYRNDPKNLAADFMNSHVADGVRTIGGFDGGRIGGQVTGWRFFGHYHAGESVSQAWINMGLEEYDCNMPIIVAYGDTEEETSRILFDGRFSTVRAGSGWAIAVEPITERHLEPRACCLPAAAGPSCVELTHAACEDAGGAPLDCGMTCEEHGEKCQ